MTARTVGGATDWWDEKVRRLCWLWGHLWADDSESKSLPRYYFWAHDTGHPYPAAPIPRGVPGTTPPKPKTPEPKQEGVYHKHVYSESRVYFIEGAGKVKIGHSHDPRGRMRDLQAGSPVPLVLFAQMMGGPEKEGALHRRFETARSHGEWYYFTDALKTYIVAHAEILEEQLLIAGEFVPIRAQKENR